jgi:hypothetical protein
MSKKGKKKLPPTTFEGMKQRKLDDMASKMLKNDEKIQKLRSYNINLDDV